MADAFRDQRALCLWIIRDAQISGITCLELQREGISNPTMRISELRRAGHVIEGRRVQGQVCHRYWCLEPLPDHEAAVRRYMEAERLLAEQAAEAKPPALLHDIDRAHGQLRVLGERLVLIPKGGHRPPVYICPASMVGYERLQPAASSCQQAAFRLLDSSEARQ